MRIGGIVDVSTVDWYGRVALIVFFAGCNFRCPYCQNPGLIPLDSGEKVDKEMLRKRIQTGVKLIDSVVFTGGEPLLQCESLIEAAEVVREFGLPLMLGTNGSIPEVVDRILKAGLVDRVALDVKAPLTSTDYSRVSGLGLNGAKIVSGVERTLELCNAERVDVEARTTVVPTLSDEFDFIRRIAKDVKGRCEAYYLQQFDNFGDVLSSELKALTPPSRNRLVELAKVALKEGVKNVYIKTRVHGLERIR